MFKGKLAHRLTEPEISPEQVLADNSAEVLKAIAAIPATDLSEIVKILTMLQSKEVDLSSLERLVRDIPKTDLNPVLDAVSGIKQPDLSPVSDRITAMESRVVDLSKKLSEMKAKKREFRFDIEREEFSDLAHTIRAVEL